jgi:pimeloyl-ACP methyl ester carboxylesterase
MPLFMMHGYPWSFILLLKILTLFSRDMLITNVMIYWVTNSFWSAIRLYSESYYNPWELQPGQRIEVPTAVAAYPHELAPIVRKRAEKYYNVVRFTEYPQGGHFAIYERAEEMAEDLREFFRPLRRHSAASGTIERP